MKTRTAEDITAGIALGQFKPYFQPIVHLATGRLIGFELLARWHHEAKGILLPRDFILRAEKAGIISELAQSIFLQAFTVLAGHGEELRLSVNISPVQLLDGALADIMEELSSKTGFDLSRLTLEVTESGLIDNKDKAIKTAGRCKRLGPKLSLDDFGTGYSSLTHLQALPFDEIKIDQSFVGSMTTRRESRKIVSAVVSLGKSLGLTIVAEGIEDLAQVEMLHWLGCDHGQGWLYGKAVPAEELGALIRNWELQACSQFVTSSGRQVVASEPFSTQPHAQLQAIYDGVPVGLCFLDRDLRHISVNRHLAVLNGIPAEAHLGRTVREMAPELFPFLEPYLDVALSGKEVPPFEFELPETHPRAPATQLISYQPARDEAGEVIGISVAIVDITAQKRTEAALRVSRDQYWDLLELNPQVPWVMSARGNILDVSSKWVATTGLTKEESMDQGWLRALHPDDIAGTIMTVTRSLRSGAPIDVEYRVNHKSLGWRWMRSRGYPKIDSDGRIVRWYGSVEDVHDRRQIEAELQISRKLLRDMSLPSQHASVERM